MSIPSTNKLLIALSKLVQQQAYATEATNEVIEKLLDYVTTYLNDRITYRSRGTVLDGHSDAAYLDAIKDRSISGAKLVS